MIFSYDLYQRVHNIKSVNVKVSDKENQFYRNSEFHVASAATFRGIHYKR